MNKEKIYILENLGCANCAAKMERRIQELPTIDSASITFATKQLKVVGDNSDTLKDELQHICQSIEAQVILVEKNPNSVSHTNHKSFISGHKYELANILVGIVLFAVGLVINSLSPEILLPDSFPVVVFTAAYLLLGYNVLFTAGRNIMHGQVFDENFLMSIATIAAFCIGDFAEGVGVMLFYRIGEFFEHIAVEKSRSQIMDAIDMRPETVNLVSNEEHEHHHEHDHHHMHEHHHHDHHCDCGCDHDHHDHHCDHDHHHDHHDHHHESANINVIPAADAKVGDILLVRPGDRIPLDGIIIDGESRIDTSPVTGEPVPVKAMIGTEVISGCVNTSGVLHIRVTKPLEDSMVTRILHSVETAAEGKPKIDKFITKFAGVYTPIVVAAAVLTAIIPSLVTGDWHYWIKTAVTFLVISCPCALVISVPLAFFSGIGAASKLGILFKGGLAIEALKNVKAVIMDKTGTITNGTFAVNSISVIGDMSEEELLEIAAACEAASTHPIAASITEAAERIHVTNHTKVAEHNHNAGQIEELAGMGVSMQFADKGSEHHALCGNAKLMAHFNIDMPDPASSSVNTVNTVESDESGTTVYVALDGKYIGSILIADTVKTDAVSAINKLKVADLIPAILTGDSLAGAEAVAAETGIDRVYAQLMPDDKLRILKELRKKLGEVMFVGDGINDAPVLAGADVGAAMGSGADAAIEAADVVFMNSSVESIPRSISIAKATGKIAMQNVIFALCIKALLLLLGFLGFANIWAAVFADTGVAMLCILNSLRILWRKF